MKTTLLVAGAALVLAGAAMASPEKKPKTQDTIKCAVMTTNSVNIKDATAKKMYSDYKGNRYFFCCGGCPGQFKADPAKFAKNAHIKTPKA